MSDEVSGKGVIASDRMNVKRIVIAVREAFVWTPKCGKVHPG